MYKQTNKQITNQFCTNSLTLKVINHSIFRLIFTENNSFCKF